MKLLLRQRSRKLNIMRVIHYFLKIITFTKRTLINCMNILSNIADSKCQMRIAC